MATKVKLFEGSWNVDLYKLEEQVNKFLATLPDGAVKSVTSSSHATRTETGQAEEGYLITVWYAA